LAIEALVITLAALLGSLVASWALYRWIFSSRKNCEYDDGTTEGEPNGGWAAVRGSMVILAFFIFGALAGCFRIFPESILQDNPLAFIALGCLMFCVGFSLGNDTSTLESFKRLDPRYMLLPLATIAGTYVGCILLGVLQSGRSLGDLLAVGSGFGYYSLSSILITEARGAELGTIALLSNIIREVLTLVLAPLMARVFGPLAPISAGGATTMDTTLPVILQTSGKGMATVSVFHGCIMDFTTPLLVMFFCG
jgi:Predicted membrane protein